MDQGEDNGDHDNQGDFLDPDDILEVIEVEDGEEPADVIDSLEDLMHGDGQPDDAFEEIIDVEGQESTQLPVVNESTVAFQLHSASIFSVDLNADNTLAVTGGEDDMAYVWRISDGSKLCDLGGSNDSIISAQFNYDGMFVAAGAMDGVIRVYSLPSGVQACELDCGDDLTCLEWHPKGNFIVGGTASGSAYMWDVPGGNMTFFITHAAAVSCLRWLPDGRTFITGSEDASIIIWSPKTQKSILRVDLKVDYQFHDAPITALSVSSDGAVILTGAQDGTVRLMQFKSGKVVGAFLGSEQSIECVGFSNTSPLLVGAGSLDGELRIYDATSQVLKQSLHHDDGVVVFKWNHTGHLVYSSSLDCKVRVWDVRDGRCLKTMHGHVGQILDMALSRDGSFVVTCGEDNAALVFNTAEFA